MRDDYVGYFQYVAAIISQGYFTMPEHMAVIWDFMVHR